MKKSLFWHPESFAGKMLTFYARKIPDHPAKIRIFRWLSFLIPKVIFWQKTARFTVILGDYIGHAICFKGNWEPLSLAASLKIMKGHENKTFLDVGANHGIFTVLIGETTGCHCLAIEPNKKNYEILLKNLRLNKRINAKPIPCAATAKKRIIRLSSEKSGNEAWTKVNYDSQAKSGELVVGRTLDEILKAEKCKRVRLLKIDVEGSEVEVFKGLDWESPCAPEAVIMECHPSESKKILFLTKRGYCAQTVDGKGIKGLKQYPEGNLLFIKTKRSLAKRRRKI